MFQFNESYDPTRRSAFCISLSDVKSAESNNALLSIAHCFKACRVVAGSPYSSSGTACELSCLSDLDSASCIAVRTLAIRLSEVRE